jgi:heme A synthase
LNSNKGEAATRSRLRPSSPAHRLFPHDCVLQLGQSFHFMTSYHTLSFTLSRSSLHRTKESPFTFRWAARAAATAVATTSATATATATATAAATTTTTASRPEIEVIQPGLALFLGTDIFQEGTSD